MKRKSKKSQNNFSKYCPFDLFGEIPVTWDEIYTWCEIVTHGRITRDSRLFQHYVDNWNVAAKIRSVKRRQPLEDYLNTHGQ